MSRTRTWKRLLPALAISLTLLTGFAALAPAAEQTITIEKPMPPPGWALMEQKLLKANGDYAELFADRYVDDRGYLLTRFAGAPSTAPTTPSRPTTTGRWLQALGGSDSRFSISTRRGSTATC